MRQIEYITRQALFPSGTVDPRVGIFLSTLNINDRFFSHIPSPNSFTNDPSFCLNMEVPKVNERNKK